jgi:hypothetical protein
MFQLREEERVELFREEIAYPPDHKSLSTNPARGRCRHWYRFYSYLCKEVLLLGMPSRQDCDLLLSSSHRQLNSCEVEGMKCKACKKVISEWAKRLENSECWG